MRFPVQHYMLQGSHVGYEAAHNGLTGTAGSHVIPATALAQYVGRHYTTQALPAHGYSIPASTWLPQYVMQPAPPHHLAQIDVCAIYIPYLIYNLKPTFTVPVVTVFRVSATAVCLKSLRFDTRQSPSTPGWGWLWT